MIVLALAVFTPGSVLGVIALVIAFAMLATSLVSWCPIWRVLGLNTCRSSGRANDVGLGGNLHGR
jgi:ABC-type lipoprotein release transport system permease subunit